MAAKLSTVEAAVFATMEHDRSYESFVLLSSFVARLPLEDQKRVVLNGATTGSDEDTDNVSVKIAGTLGMLQKWKQKS